MEVDAAAAGTASSSSSATKDPTDRTANAGAGVRSARSSGSGKSTPSSFGGLVRGFLVGGAGGKKSTRKRSAPARLGQEDTAESSPSPLVDSTAKISNTPTKPPAKTRRVKAAGDGAETMDFEVGDGKKLDRRLRRRSSGRIDYCMDHNDSDSDDEYDVKSDDDEDDEHTEPDPTSHRRARSDASKQKQRAPKRRVLGE